MRLTEIYVHPLKSGRGNLVAEAALDSLGLQHDRRWMLITPEGRFLTGRQHPRLVLVTAEPSPSGVSFQAPGQDPLSVDLNDLEETLEVEVWGDRFPARSGALEADFWFSDYLGSNVRLAYVGTDSLRRSELAPQVPVAFVDGYPPLLIGTATLADLNARLAQPVSMRHFRTNLVVETGQPFAEDAWKRLRIGAVEFANVKPCTRCVFTTIDPDSGIASADRQPMATLLRYRRFEDGTRFGVNLVALNDGTLRQGDPVEILE